MKLIKTASGKKKIKMSKSEWQTLGKQAGWMKEASAELAQQLESPLSIATSLQARYIQYLSELQANPNGGFMKVLVDTAGNALPMHFSTIYETLKQISQSTPNLQASINNLIQNEGIGFLANNGDTINQLVQQGAMVPENPNHQKLLESLQQTGDFLPRAIAATKEIIQQLQGQQQPVAQQPAVAGQPAQAV